MPEAVLFNIPLFAWRDCKNSKILTKEPAFEYRKALAYLTALVTETCLLGYKAV
jgi:hypothetical protein